MCLCHTFSKRTSWEVEPLEQRPCPHDCLGQAPGAAVGEAVYIPRPVDLWWAHSQQLDSAASAVCWIPSYHHKSSPFGSAIGLKDSCYFKPFRHLCARLAKCRHSAPSLLYGRC